MSTKRFISQLYLQQSIISGIWIFNKESFLSDIKYSLYLYFTSPPEPSFNLMVLILVLVKGHLNGYCNLKYLSNLVALLLS